MTLDIERLIAFEREASELKGWNLDYQPRQLEPGPPWDYMTIARERLNECRELLDIGTGGGEVLAELLADKNLSAIATEEYKVNAPVAKNRLSHRAKVVRASGESLPFPDDCFDVVLSRHTAINPTEVARVLKPGARFLTQQVIPDFMRELAEFFPDATRFPDHFADYQSELAASGMEVLRAHEFRTVSRFKEPGHLVYFLVAAPWSVPDFTLSTHLAALVQLVEENKSLEFTTGFYMIEAVHA